MLLQLFSMFCFICKSGKPSVKIRENGTMVVVTQTCKDCGGSFQWKSQPMIFNRYPAGNILMSFAMLMAGAKISRFLLVCKHMGLSVISPRTYLYHQKKFLFPQILSFWNSYREKLIKRLESIRNISWAGDGRFDSMGHSAKFGLYSMLCPTILKIVHFELIQVMSHVFFVNIEYQIIKSFF